PPDSVRLRTSVAPFCMTAIIGLLLAAEFPPMYWKLESLNADPPEVRETPWAGQLMKLTP
ncbi:hypothetical protein, partial [Bacillus toyonensis]|uniref:hypothetical protein n=1 Tax=Bacillus toyonensis TaxID=155322 RepID=UPI0035E1E8F5